MRSRTRRGNGSPAGFTIVELVVAMVVIGVLLLVMAAVLVSTLRVIAQSRERQQAAALATQVVEQVRALPWSTVSAGLAYTEVYPTGAQTDPRIISGKFVFVRNSISESLVTYNTGTAQAPLTPHRRIVSVEGYPDFTVSTYVTSATTAGALNLSVIVDWTSRAGGKAQQVVQRDTLYSPTSCLSTSLHPFSAPCQAAYAAEAGLTNASVAVSSGDGAGVGIPGLGSSNLALVFPQVSSSIGEEASIQARGEATAGGALADGASPSKLGQGTVTVVADADPNSPDPVAKSGTIPPGSTGLVSTSGAAGSLTATASSSESGAAAATTSGASGCSDASGTALSGATVCASAAAPTSGASEAAITYALPDSLGSTLSVTRLVSTPATVPARSFVARYVAPSGSVCSGTSGTGCVVAGVSRTVESLKVGGLPFGWTGVAPGFEGLVRLSSLAETANAAVGVGVAPVTSYSRTGNLEFWDGSSYGTPRKFAALGAGDSGTLGPVTASGSDGYSITVSGTWVVAPLLTTSNSGALPCKTTACISTQKGDSAFRISVTYVVMKNNVELTHFTVVGDTGKLVTKTSYLAAPDA